MADSVIKDINNVEQYGKNLKKVSQQQIELYNNLKRKIENMQTFWKDDSFRDFQDQFNKDIMKNVQEISDQLEMFAAYIEKQCEFHKQAKANKW